MGAVNIAQQTENIASQRCQTFLLKNTKLGQNEAS